MSTHRSRRKLREPGYQGFDDPAIEARANADAARVMTRVFQESMGRLLSKRDDGPATIPLLGDVSITDRIRAFVSERALSIYIAALCGLSVGLAAYLVERGPAINGPWWAVAVLCIVALLAEKQPVRITPNAELTVSVLPVLFAAVALGPLAAMLVAAVGLLGDFGRPHARWLVWTSMRALAGGCAGLAAAIAMPAGGPATVGALAGGVVLATVTEPVVDALLGGVVVLLRRTGTFFGYLRAMRPIIVVTVPLYAPVLVLLVYAYQELSALSVLLFFAPAFAAQSLYRLYREERVAVEELGIANDRLERANLSFAGALVAALDARDRYTAGHSAAVAIYARDIAAALKLSEAEQQSAHLCGLVHDIGKVGLPPGILEKPGPLTLEERRTMEEHSSIGERILANVEDYSEIAKIVRHHHERIDGLGYPDRLAEDDIPLISRIIAVADAYNAMTSERPYRDAMPSQVARSRLAQGAGSQFDAAVVAAFERILSASAEPYRLGLEATFVVEAGRQVAFIAEPLREACVA
jgi:putative nucleotidyltransferase with HDIG domain